MRGVGTGAVLVAVAGAATALALMGYAGVKTRSAVYAPQPAPVQPPPTNYPLAGGDFAERLIPYLTRELTSEDAAAVAAFRDEALEWVVSLENREFHFRLVVALTDLVDQLAAPTPRSERLDELTRELSALLVQGDDDRDDG